MENDFLNVSVGGKTPELGNKVFVAPDATLVGDVVVGDECSIWFKVILRGDVSKIRVGNKCNIQDGTIVHGMYQKWDVTLEDEVSIGHGVILHGCHIEKGAMIGMGALLMDGVRVGAGSLVAAGSLVTEGTQIPAGHLAMGRPAKVLRPLRDKEIELLRYTTNNYLMYKDWYGESQ